MPPGQVDRNLRLLFAFWFLREFQLWVPVWIVYLTLERGFSFTQVTAAESLFLIGVIALEVPTGAIADRFGRRVSLGLGALCLASSVTIFAFTTSPLVLFASFAWWAVASTLMSGADMALLYDTLKAGGREHEYERLAGRGMAIAWCGVGLATLFGGPVASLLDTRATILIGAVTCVIAAGVAFALWEPPRVTQEHEGGARTYLGTMRRAFQEAWRTRALRYLMLLFGVTVAGIETVHFLVQPYLVENGIAVGTLFSLLQVPLFVAGILGALVAGRLEGRAGSVRGLLLLGLAGTLMLGMLALSPSFWMYGALPILMAVNACAWPLMTGAINRQVGSERRATILSIASMHLSLAMALLAPAVGFSVDTWGVGAAFGLGAAAALAGIVMFGGPALTAWRESARDRRAGGQRLGGGAEAFGGE
jgi:MFS family permease